ncbi:angiotensin-converting enzyme-like [Oppia nitens]|uniref:angiotensin-converting enzyme-like n=1 Tax=Oppia nitens TaxID=1686743 RepID=UPI0023DBD303|nr:angiotensin-converting enzyme-like [Oppia nitens]
MESNINSQAQWNYAVNINDDTEKARDTATVRFNDFQKRQLSDTQRFNWSTFEPFTKRQFEKLGVIGTAALDKDDEETYNKVTSNMETIYSTAKINVKNRKDLSLEPDLTKIMAESDDYDELQEVWVNWRDATGSKMRDDFIKYYELGNKAAKLNKLPDKEFKTLDDLWLFSWETPDIKEQTEKLWTDGLKPFYEKLHAYIRHKLSEKYPGKMPKDGTIPAHLLGNMWAQQWSNILQTVDGIGPDAQTIDVKQAMIDQGYNATVMFKKAEKFFVDLGLDPMTDEFWKKSVTEKIPDKQMVCHASAWDFMDQPKKDFRIKQCTDVTMEDLITVHHEMGHIQYYQQYKNQPTVYREGANPGFHEAIGDLLALSVSTPKHLRDVLKLLDSSVQVTDDVNIRFQLQMALDKLAFLPFGYIMDKWRWDVFSGQTSSANLNRHWWELRLKYQGISPPVKRSENDFDPGAKYHIPASVEYIRYFVSHILQFQFHQKLCSFRENNEKLHECDIDGDKDAGKLLKIMLSEGSSKTWPVILKQFTGNTDKMDVQPLIQYFKPLNDYLDSEIKAADIKVGWDSNVDDYFTSSSNPVFKTFTILSTILARFVANYANRLTFDPGMVLDTDTYTDIITTNTTNDKITDQEIAKNYLSYVNHVLAMENNLKKQGEWNYAVNINRDTEKARNAANVRYNNYKKAQLAQTQRFNWSTFEPYIKRQFEKLAVIGTAALDKDDEDMYHKVTTNMETIYSTAKINVKGKHNLSLEPVFTESIGDLMALSVQTPKHLRDVLKLLNSSVHATHELDIKFQLQMALDKLAFLPFAYIMDKWRWDVFNGQTSSADLNRHWWKLRLKYQGISPPVKRTKRDFDPGAKMHISANIEYIRYFVSHILQFQFHQKLCSFREKNESLHNCDINGDKEAGNLLKIMLSKGSSKTWPVILKEFTGTTDKLDVQPMIQYFKPLNDYLDNEIKTAGIKCLLIECKPTNKTTKPKTPKHVITDESLGTDLLANFDKEYIVQQNRLCNTNWDYDTDMTEAKLAIKSKSIELLSAFQKRWTHEVNQYNWTDFLLFNSRQFEKIAVIGTSALKPAEEKKYYKVTNKMEKIYSTAKICVDGECMLEFKPDIERIFTESKSYETLKEAWVNWRAQTGKKMRNYYIQYYQLGNRAAKLNELPNKKFNTLDDLWLASWETPNIKEETLRLLMDVMPLYKKLHAYVRMHLRKQYGETKDYPQDGTIPAHLLGNMWAQDWANLMEKQPGIDPYPDVAKLDVTNELRRQNYTAKRMFELADSFFINLGLSPMTPTFWNRSVIEKIPNRQMVCHAYAMDFFDISGNDFRIKMCTDITMYDLVTVHHEMGHIQYFMNYRDQPGIYREGGNPGFHEAIGDMIALSVSTPKHLAKIKLLKLNTDSAYMKKITIKFQLQMALGKVAQLPWAYLVDKWRWDVFSEKIPASALNKQWWKLRGQLQGLSPPVKRSEQDFDAGAKYHVATNMEYIRYFAAILLQFQFHKSLCQFSQKNVPLYECDIDGDRDAGNKLRTMLSIGSSDLWPKQLELMTGTDRMDAKPMLEYFEPLNQFLDEQLKNETIDWDFDVEDYFDNALQAPVEFRSSKKRGSGLTKSGVPKRKKSG